MKDLQETLQLHRNWLDGEDDGIRADLYRADLSSADLSGANLSSANLSSANLSGADLSRANLSSANLYRADLSSANLSSANLSGADLSSANLSSADLSGANLSSANLSGADLYRADLSSANLSGADLYRADLSSANLSSANLSSAVGLLSSIEWMDKNAIKSEDGYIFYKTFDNEYPANENWIIERGCTISENTNPLRTNDCGCGINVATREWVNKNYGRDLWACLIKWEWLVGVVVPYNTDGKIRAEKVQLLYIVDRETGKEIK